MSIWFRCSENNHTDKVFSGEGGLHVAGRWNHKGTKAIYCSQSIALCILEWLSHNGLSVSGFRYYKFSIEIPDQLIIRYPISDLPEEWCAMPSMNHHRDFVAKHFYTPNQYLAMAVPSVVVPEECNLVINPLHASFATVIKTIRSLGEHVAPNRS